jgi:hypothetical protein
MFFIRQGATHKVVIGPAVAVGDGFTPVTTLAVSSADEAEAILHDNGTVVDISGYTFAAITTADGYYHLTLQSGISNTVGHMTVVINDDSLILPLRADFTVLEESIYDAMYASGATGALPATLVQGGINTTAGTITTLDGLDTAQDTQHATTQTYLSTNLGSLGANATEAGGTGDQFTDLALSAAGVSAVQSGLATPTNITAGTITTVTNLTNAPANGDLTATMKASVTSAVPAATAIGTQVWATAGRALSDPAGFKKNTQADLTFVMRDSTNGRDPIAGETVTAQRSLDKAAFGSCANSVTEIGSGAYGITLAAADLNADIVILRFTSSGSDDLLITIKTET